MQRKLPTNAGRHEPFRIRIGHEQALDRPEIIHPVQHTEHVAESAGHVTAYFNFTCKRFQRTQVIPHLHPGVTDGVVQIYHAPVRHLPV